MKKPISSDKLHKLYIETGKQKVVEVLFRYPEKEFSLSDLAKEAGVAKANIGDILHNLSAFGFVEIKKLTKIWRIRANQSDWNFVKAKIIQNLNIVYQSGIIEFLVDYYKTPKAVVLFGSFRKGEDISNSDIDIAVEVDVDEYKVFGLRELSELEKSLGRKIQIHLFDRKNVDLNVFNNIANGIVLWGFLEVRP